MAVFTIGSLSVRESALVGALIIDCVIQLAGWVISSALKTDKIYDMLGSTAFAVVAIGTLTYAHYYYARQIIVTVMVLLWALRLGGFLVLRVMATGGDSRFNEVKDKPFKYFVYWFLQAVWVWVTTLPVQTLNATANNPGLWASDIVGGVIWIIGFLCESTADIQKFRFKQNPANKGKFITVGLWKWSRHPNYFGEMCMWWGIWLMSICILEKGYWLSVFSPLLTMGLLLFVSGIPIQEKQAKKRWGDDPAYQKYLRHSNLLVPLPLKFWAKDPPESEQRLEARTSSDTQREGV